MREATSRQGAGGREVPGQTGRGRWKSGQSDIGGGQRSNGVIKKTSEGNLDIFYRYLFPDNEIRRSSSAIFVFV